MNTKTRTATKAKTSPAAKTATKTKSGKKNQPQVKISMEEQDIAVAAYYRAQARNFAPGYELKDWLEAERDIHANQI